MKNKFKKIIMLFSLLIFSFSISTIVKADSGWDSSYDSGGGSWDSGSSWGSDSSWDSSSSGSYSSGDPIGTIIIFVIIVIVVIIISKNNPQGGSGSGIASKKINDYKEVSDEEIEKYGLKSTELKDITYNIYKDIQNAWTDMDYKKLRTKLTDEIYNSYTMQLDALKLKHQKNIMKDFEYVDAKIIDVKEENGLLNIKVYLNVKMYDYVVDKYNKTIRGNDKKRIDIEYIITLVKASNKKKKGKTLCPNCGAEIESTSGGTCEYCGSTVVEDAKDFVMSSKTCIGQR